MVALMLLACVTVTSAVEPVDLNTAGEFTLLTKSGITTTGPTKVTGDIGTSPITYASLTGFNLTLDGGGTFSTSPLVDGKVFAADYAVPTPAKMTKAVSDMEAAYTDAAGRPYPVATELGAGGIGGMTLTGGVYKWSTVVTVAVGEILNFDAEDNPDTVWIMQIAQGLNFMANSKVELLRGAKSSNIFWQVAGVATILADAHAEGVILCATAITFEDGGSLTGRGLAQTSVTMIANTVIPPASCFFVYSADPSLAYLLANMVGSQATPPFAVVPPFPSLVGKVWEGVVLTIEAPETETVMPETVTGQDDCWTTNPLCLYNIAVMSEEFCLPHGTYSINLTPTSTSSTREQRISNDCNIQAALNLTTSYMFSPEWAIFPASLRDEGLAAVAALVVGLENFNSTAINIGVGWAGLKDDLKVQYASVGGCGRNLIVPPTFFNERNAVALAVQAAETEAALVDAAWAACDRDLKCIPEPPQDEDDSRRRLAIDCAGTGEADP